MPIGGVPVACCVGDKCIDAGGGVVVAGGVIKERLRTSGRVLAASCVAVQGIKT
jgi:hypothetical protein